MKRLATITAVLLSTTSAPATELMQSGYWSTFTTYANSRDPQFNGAAVCGTQTAYGNGNAIVFVKYFHGRPGLAFQLFKPGWQGSYHIPMSIYLDRELAVSAYAVGSDVSSGMGMIEFTIDGNGSISFLQQFADADWMWIRFDAGNEGMWLANMRGSRDAANSFVSCIDNVRNSPTEFSHPVPTANSGTWYGFVSSLPLSLVCTKPIVLSGPDDGGVSTIKVD
jgi:hypothetical protein